MAHSENSIARAADPSLAFGYADRFDAVKETLPGARLPWLEAARAEAIGRFRALGLPGSRAEEWKYTSLRKFAKVEFAPLATPAAVAESVVVAAAGDLGGHRLVFVDGCFVPALSAVGRLPKGVRLESLAARFAAGGDDLPSPLGRAARLDRHALLALNTAFMRDGCVLDIADGAALDEPIHLIFISATAGGAHHARNLVCLGCGGHATLIETHIAIPGADKYWSNPITEITLGEGAMLRHYKIQDEALGAFHLALATAELARASRYENFSAHFGSGLARNEIHLRFDGEGGDGILNGIYLLRGEQHGDTTTRIDHDVPHCSSREVYKGVLDGRARGVFQGRIAVKPGAQKTDGHQLCRTLLLSREAEIDIKPELQIHADDVKCSHGAAAGEIEEDALFYMRARGIDAERARSLLIESFVGEVIDGITVAAVGDRLRDRVAAWLAGDAKA